MIYNHQSAWPAAWNHVSNPHFGIYGKSLDPAIQRLSSLISGFPRCRMAWVGSFDTYFVEWRSWFLSFWRSHRRNFHLYFLDHCLHHLHFSSSYQWPSLIFHRFWHFQSQICPRCSLPFSEWKLQLGYTNSYFWPLAPTAFYLLLPHLDSRRAEKLNFIVQKHYLLWWQLQFSRLCWVKWPFWKMIFAYVLLGLLNLAYCQVIFQFYSILADWHLESDSLTGPMDSMELEPSLSSQSARLENLSQWCFGHSGFLDFGYVGERHPSDCGSYCLDSCFNFQTPHSGSAPEHSGVHSNSSWSHSLDIRWYHEQLVASLPMIVKRVRIRSCSS